jgi:tetratricopeptide (TPR) repeat protein
VAFFDRLRRLVPGATGNDPFARGTRELDRGRLDAAEVTFREALGLATTAAGVAAVRNKLAVIAVRRLDRDAAVEQLILALEADPRCAAAITTLGNLLLESEAIDEAIVHYEAALRIDDRYAPAYHNLGVALHRSGRRGEAVRMLRQATRIEGRMIRK